MSKINKVILMNLMLYQSTLYQKEIKKIVMPYASCFIGLNIFHLTHVFFSTDSQN